MRTPVVSVVIAAHEAEGFIGRAVRSALAQTLGDIEVIVVDDASQDATIGAAVAAAEGDARLMTVRLGKNGGPSAARNAGFALAAGKWIAVLDADDAMAPERLDALVRVANDDGADMVADALVVVEEGREDEAGTEFRCSGLPAPITLASFARDNRMYRISGGSGYLKPMFRREFLRANGLSYDATLRVAEDWTLAAEALARGARYVLSERPLYRYTMRQSSISARLSCDKLEKMIASADAFLERHRARLDADTLKALGERRTSLENALAFQLFLDRMKAGKPFGAAAAIAKRPGAAPLLRMPIEARLKGTRGARDTFK